MSKYTFFSLPVLAITLLSGCSESKDDAAIRKALNRPKSAFARVFNANKLPVGLTFRGITMGTATEGMATEFKPLAVGNPKVVLTVNGTPKEVEIPTKSDVGTTIVLFGNGQIATIEDEARYPKGLQNARVIFLDESMKPLTKGASTEVKGPAGVMKFSAEEQLVSIPAGDWPGVLGWSTVDPAYAYTLIFTKSGANWVPHFFVNSPTDKVSAGGVSQ